MLHINLPKFTRLILCKFTAQKYIFLFEKFCTKTLLNAAITAITAIIRLH